ncbi:ATPase [Halogeometricum borinquense]|uniref:ATPase involved in flagella biogenesis n=2 Tax=Halogeometricum borinquense TaxID=60847 RepID=E4NP49_HALBP|nr:ATPase domain-containing protein [Halogeometricum borinquense]ADQ67590.1 predicted ATPase involved in flagella biogenesis [Halogeometricum borinquense DSM 11551]ELY23729.1 ATPase involved in flagella biogenesis [Halogeometricum borinquense DSM 11551]QIB73816.1 ATPase [Halogeometricum borinquense]QIQ76826.1 ATPase [Halogeometricum borinquense]RYJ13457.1 ATPase [Halogeometricum borinquense]
MKSNQFSLGLQQHDRLQKELGGGIPRGAIVLIEGDYGAGKSVLSQRFTYGFSQEDIVTSLISTELGVRGFLDQMHSLEYDMVKPLLNEEVLFIPAEIDASGALTGGNASERKQLLRRLMEAETLWEADVTIIDTFDAILRNDPQFEALVRQNEERQAALEIISFFRELTTKNKTIILTVDPSTVDEDAIGPFRSIADVYLQLEMVEVGNDVRRNIFVKRFAGMGEQVGDRIGFSVRSGIGIVIESRSVA